MKKIILIIPMMVFLANCSASSITVSANIPESQEVDISIKTTDANKQ